MILLLFSGIVLGATCGITPGPLLTFIISQTFNYGFKEGAKATIAPLITDLPIILFSILLLSKISGFEPLIGIISLFGAGYIMYLGYQSLTFSGMAMETVTAAPQSIRKGILANIFNPNPYVFWVSVGAPIVINALDVSVLAAVLFLFAMYACLVGSKMLTALILGKSRQFLKNKYYINILRLLGVVLLVFAIIYLKDGLHYLGLF